MSKLSGAFPRKSKAPELDTAIAELEALQTELETPRAPIDYSGLDAAIKKLGQIARGQRPTKRL